MPWGQNQYGCRICKTEYNMNVGKVWDKGQGWYSHIKKKIIYMSYVDMNHCERYGFQAI